MKSKQYLSLVLALTSLVYSGCSSMPGGNPVGYVLSSAGGAAVGSSVSDSKWAPAAGAAAGLIAYAAYNEIKGPSNQKIYEAYEQGKREARTEVAKEFWINETDGNGVAYEEAKKTGATGEVSARVMQEQRYIEGVNYGAVYYEP
jgi:hypothetical protein